MKRKVLIISIICVLLVITFIVICSSFNKDSIDKTKSIIVTNLKSDNISKKEITDKDKIKEVISIIKERKELEKDTTIEYGIPDYKLEFFNGKGNTIKEVKLYYYNDGTAYITFDDNEYFSINGIKLLNIVGYSIIENSKSNSKWYRSIRVCK